MAVQNPGLNPAYSLFITDYYEVKRKALCIILLSAQENIFRKKSQIASEFVQLIALGYFLTI